MVLNWFKSNAKYRLPLQQPLLSPGQDRPIRWSLGAPWISFGVSALQTSMETVAKAQSASADTELLLKGYPLLVWCT